jgi:hypothetical protein
MRIPLALRSMLFVLCMLSPTIGCDTIVGNAVPFGGHFVHGWYSTCHWCGARCWDTGSSVMTREEHTEWIRANGGVGDDGFIYCSKRCMSAAGATGAAAREESVPRNQ